MMLNPLVLRLAPYAALVAVLAFAGYKLWSTAYEYGSLAAKEQCETRVDTILQSHQEALQRAQAKYAKQQAEAVQEVTRYWEENQRIETVTQTIEKEVIRYVRQEAASDNVCEFDDDFLRIWNAANDNKHGTENNAGPSG